MIRLFELRSEKEWSQRETAKKLFVSQGTYNNWENGKTQPSIEQLILLSKIFDVSIDYIVGNCDDTEVRLPVKKVLTKDQSSLIDKIISQLQLLKENIKGY